MNVYKILVDEYPESCRGCGFCKKWPNPKESFGECLGLPEDNNTVCTSWSARYRRHDCPLVKAERTEKAGESGC